LDFRIGIGSDIHQLKTGLPLFIGGVQIPSKHGALAHSDGDVLIHAICDAIFGALGLGDIGEHFPDNKAEFKNQSSTYFLDIALKKLQENKFHIVNLDSNVYLQTPKLSPFKNKIKSKLAEILQIGEEIISVKAKTYEGLGEIGKSKAIKADCALLLKRIPG
jgi:2-C-methyl-D-erythritol 2,4-cyclodiphosphate synthase